MSIVDPLPMEPIVDDPDDYRPRSRWALVVDPGDGDGRVERLSIIAEEIAKGERIPLHTHDVDEAIAILEGRGRAPLGSGEALVEAGATVFIPACVPHSTENIGKGFLRIHAIFPSTSIEISMIERNPAPGTEGASPSRSRYNLRPGAFEILD